MLEQEQGKDGTIPAPYLDGEKVLLIPLNEADYVHHNMIWTNDPVATELMHRGTFPTSIEQHRAAYHASLSNSGEFELFVVEKQTSMIVGIAGLHAISWIARHAEFRILIGDRSVWGKGLGSETLRLLCHHGFRRLNLNKIWLGVAEVNSRAIRSYEKAGFSHEGRLRQEAYVQGKLCDVLRMSCLRTEFDGLDG